MKTTEFIVVNFKGEEYKIDIYKLEIVLSVLAKKPIKITSEKLLNKYLKSYKLYNKDFLENINKI